MRLLVPLLSLALVACSPPDGSDPVKASSSSIALPDREVVIERVESDEVMFRVVRVVDSLQHPWGVDWLPDGRTLITERGGSMHLVDGDQRTALSNVPEVWADNQGGLLDVRVAPPCEETGWIYFMYSMQEDEVGGTVLARARLDGTALTDVEEVYGRRRS
jgi:glucose/arabinose dehydrogenase